MATGTRMRGILEGRWDSEEAWTLFLLSRNNGREEGDVVASRERDDAEDDAGNKHPD